MGEEVVFTRISCMEPEPDAGALLMPFTPALFQI